MKAHLPIILALALLLFAGQSGASYWFKVIDISPSPIEVTAGDSANFTILVKGLGSERAYVELVFKNKTQGLQFSCPKMIKNVYPAGVTDFNCSLLAAGDVAPGNYSFVVDVAAKSAPSGKMTGYINVLSPGGRAADDTAGAQAEEAVDKQIDGATDEPIAAPQAQDQPQEEPQEQPKDTPAPGAGAAIMGLMLTTMLFAQGRKKS